MNPEEFKKNISQSPKSFSKKKCLQNMTTDELANLPKEVIITYTSNEISNVWDRLPERLKNDHEMEKYRYCTEHYNGRIEDDIDHPQLRRIFCCYCKIKEVNVGSSNKVKMKKVTRKRGGCCCTIK